MAIKEVKKPEDLVPGDDKGTPDPDGVKKPEDEKGKNKGRFKKLREKISNGWHEVKDSPVATAIGMVIGAVATGAAIVATEIIKTRHAAQDQDLLEEAEPIEQEFEEEPEAENEPSEEEEVQEEVA